MGYTGNFANYARNLIKASSQYVEVGQNSTLVYGVKFIVGSNAPNGFMFQSNIGGTMTTHMSIRGNNGSVGIGTANPGSLLTISGNSDDGDNACALRIIDEDDTGGSKLPAIMFYGGSTIQGRIRGGDGTFAIAVGSSPSTALSIDTTSRKLTLGSYGSGTHTGTATYKLSVNSNGDIIETAIGAGAVDGSGTANYVTKWTDGDTIGNSQITDNGTSVGINQGSPNAANKLEVHNGNITITSGKQLISTNTYSQAPIGMLTIQGPTTGSTALTASQFGIVIGPQHTRSATANTYYPGIVFNHLLNHTGQSTYNSAPQAYIGTRLHDTSGSERDFLVFATKSGTGTSASDVPIERMCIDPVYGSIGIGSTDPAAQLQIGRSQSTSAFTDSFIKLRPSNTTNSTGLTSITLGTSTVDNYGYSISGWRAGTDGSPYLRIQRHNNSATGTDVMVMNNNGDAFFYGGNWYCNHNNSSNVTNGGLYINRGGGLYAYALATARSGTALNGVDFWDYHGVGLVFGPDSSTKVLTVKSNIGIGTTDPAYKLDVYGADARIGTNLRLGNGSAAGNSTNPAITVSAVNTAGVYFENSGVGFGAGSGSKYLFLSSAGNASLGGNGFFKQLGDRPYGTDNLNDYYRSNDEASFCQFYRYDATHGHWANSSGTLTTNAPSTLTQTTSQIYSYGSLLTLRSLNSFRGQFYFAHSASEFYWRSGWGTSSDQNWTRIVGDRNIQTVINNVGTVSIGGASATSGVALSVKGDTEFLDGDTGTRIGLLYDNGTEGILDLRDNNVTKVNLRTAGASYFTGGNVGIGTASPASLLHVLTGAPDFGVGAIIQHDTSSAGRFATLSFGAGSYRKAAIAIESSGDTNGTGDLVFAVDSNNDAANVASGDEKMRIQSDGNVGIGTASPVAKLHIQSDGSHDEGAEIVLRHSNNNSTDVVSTISFQNNGGQVAKIESGTTGANNTGYISFFTDSTGTSGERMRIQGNGFVGIGTATAYSPLQVYSSEDQKILLSGSANPYIRWQNGGSNRAYIQWVESSNSLSFFNSTGDNFDFYTHDSSVLAIRLKGNDGDNWGYVYAEEGTSQAHAVGFLDGDGAWAARHVKDTSWDFRINNDSKMTINNLGTVAIGGTTLLTNEGMILNRSGGAGYVAFYDGSGGAKWNIQRNAGVSNCLRIHAYNNTSQVFKVTKHYNDTDGFNILLDSGSVGMGTNSPNKTLEVRYVSTSTDVTQEGLSGGAAGKGLLIYNTQASNNVYASIDFRARDADGRIAYQYQTATNVGDFHFITDNTASPQTMMIIKNDGKVGMGTITPAGRLHVYRPAGTVPGLLCNSNRDGARVNFNYTSNTTTLGEIGMTYYGTNGDCQIWMGANLNSNSSSHSGPAVGVAGTGASSWYTVWNTQTAQDFYGIYRRSPSPSSSYENYFRIKSDGNVGINTTNPTDRLHVRSVQSAGNGSGSNLATLSLETYNSNSDDHGSYVKCKNYGGGGGGPDWKIGGMEGYWTTNKVASIDFITGDDWYNPGNKDEGEIGFTVYNNTGSGSTAIEAMRIHQTGNIGIGSTNPGSKLTVNGSFSASSKSFLIDHPTKENKKLEHGCLEGPEFGVYHRGATQSNTITLPDYWSGLVREGTVTVQLTPRGGFQHLYVVSTSLSEIVIGAADGETIDCFYTIYGERADIDSLVVEKDV